MRSKDFWRACSSLPDVVSFVTIHSGARNINRNQTENGIIKIANNFTGKTQTLLQSSLAKLN